MDCLAVDLRPQQSDLFRQLNGCFVEQTLAEKTIKHRIKKEWSKKFRILYQLLKESVATFKWLFASYFFEQIPLPQPK